MKFSIRDLLLVTVIVAVCVAWWLDRSKLADELSKSKPYPYPTYPKQTPVLQWADGAWASQQPNSQAPAPVTPKK